MRKTQALPGVNVKFGCAAHLIWKEKLAVFWARKKCILHFRGQQNNFKIKIYFPNSVGNRQCTRMDACNIGSFFCVCH